MVDVTDQKFNVQIFYANHAELSIFGIPRASLALTWNSHTNLLDTTARLLGHSVFG